ncbi:RyR domain-containing protein [Bailinhaonella thermotolerans]|uniref:Uncharacterized protein n=1 Tax=Bailinhaonella thermotolerans TaxID=1070861 RepID=A0A3A4AYC1_9ACTN|nr:RyR domain-containing protein [Bailinhaonella thermotolerans]RJL32496.1 hypothetical protein D5H75_13280 [Bailinhaonella thermotolerans]
MNFPASTVVRVSFGLLALAAAFTGFFGLTEFSEVNLRDSPPSFFDLLYWDLQLFVFESGPVEEGEQAIPAMLQFARFVAPLVTVATVVDGARLLFAAELRRIKARNASDHVVVCGSGAVAIALIERLRDTAPHIVVISSAPTTAWADPAVLQVVGDARNPATLRAAGVHQASTLYACEADSATNTAIALAAHSVSRSGRHEPLSAYALIPDPDLCNALRARRLSAPGKRRLRLDFFNLDELAARVLLDQHPVRNDQPIVVIGLNAFGRSLLVEVARRRRLYPPPVRLPVTCIDTEASRAIAALCRRFEFIAETCDLTVHNVRPADLDVTRLLPDRTPQRVFVCYDDQDLALKTALTSLRLWCCGPDSLVVRVEQTATFGRAFQDVQLLEGLSGTLRIFAINEEAGDPRLIAEDIVETLARAIHDNYVFERISRHETTPAHTSAMLPWEDLPAYLQAANRSQAEDIGRKLARIGCALAPRVEPDLDFTFKDHEIETLAAMEHERWLNDLVGDGWTHGPVRDSSRKHHPDIRPWDDLSPRAQEKDREIIRNLPALLSTAGFQIVRVT